MLGYCWVCCRLSPPTLWIADQVRNDVVVVAFHHVIASSYSDGELLGVAFPRAVDTGSSAE